MENLDLSLFDPDVVIHTVNYLAGLLDELEKTLEKLQQDAAVYKSSIEDQITASVTDITKTYKQSVENMKKTFHEKCEALLEIAHEQKINENTDGFGG